MANDCYFLLKAVAREKGSLERLLAIMNYEDPEGLFLYRVRELSVDKPPTKAGGFWIMELSGDVAWSDYYWFHDYYNDHDKIVRQYVNPEANINTNIDPEEAISRKNIRTFKELCPLLDMGVESWTEELGCQFQGHCICTSSGNVVVEEEKPYSTDENGKPEKGYEGFRHAWGDWSPLKTIYGNSEEGVKRQ
jgi:hypothetical protein